MNPIATTVAANLLWDCDFPHPDWPRIRTDEHLNLAPADRDLARITQVREWISILRDHLGGGYAVREGNRAMLLSEQPTDAATETLSFIEKTITALVDALEGNGERATFGKHVVIVFSEQDDYYSYIAHFFPDGHFGLNGGCCIQEQEVHIAVNGITPEFQEVLVHELVHDLLSHLSLPLWIEEGIAEVLPKYVLDRAPDPMSLEIETSFAQHWHWHGLSQFWTGASFQRPDGLAYYSYRLGELLVRRMNQDNPVEFNRFVRDATRDDAGESACLAHFGVSLIHYVIQVLGPGPWFAPERSIALPPLPPAAGRAPTPSPS